MAENCTFKAQTLSILVNRKGVILLRDNALVNWMNDVTKIESVEDFYPVSVQSITIFKPWGNNLSYEYQTEEIFNEFISSFEWRIL